MTIYIFTFLSGTFLSSISQILMKASAIRAHRGFISEYLNVRMAFAMFLFFCATLLAVFGYKEIPLSWGPILDSSGYLFVSLLSIGILKEKITRKKAFGLVVIVLGIIVYSLPDPPNV